MNEEWRSVPGFPDYEVSDQGRVRSWRRRSWNANPVSAPRSVSGCVGKNGYVTVYVAHDGLRARKYLHQLVLEAFVGPCPAGMVCRHFPDRDKRNNRLANISWGTEAQNAADKLVHGTQPRGDTHWYRSKPELLPRGTDRSNAKLTDDAVREIRALLAAGERQVDVAARFGVHRVIVSKIKCRKIWSHVA